MTTTAPPHDSFRRDPYADLSASQAYRARPHEPVIQPYASTYDGVPLVAPIWTGVYGGVDGAGGWGVVSARARLGVMAEPAFFYATGGVALIDGSARVEVTGNGYQQRDRNAPALVVGSGAEIGLGERAAMRIEALHYLANEKRYAFPDAATARFGGDMTTVCVGLTFCFN